MVVRVSSSAFRRFSILVVDGQERGVKFTSAGGGRGEGGSHLPSARFLTSITIGFSLFSESRSKTDNAGRKYVEQKTKEKTHDEPTETLKL